MFQYTPFEKACAQMPGFFPLQKRISIYFYCFKQTPSLTGNFT